MIMAKKNFINYLISMSGDNAATVKADIERANSGNIPKDEPELALLKGYELHKPDEIFLASPEVALAVLEREDVLDFRYSPGKIRFPAKAILPMLVLPASVKGRGEPRLDDTYTMDVDFGRGPVKYNLVQGVWLDLVTVKPFGKLTDDDARANGGTSAKELRAALNGIYGGKTERGYIGEGELVSGYEINMLLDREMTAHHLELGGIEVRKNR
jgi:hypothetical protein